MFCCIIFALSAEGKVIYVDGGAGPGGDGTSWATAYVELQSALAEVTYGDHVLVAAGTYKPDYDPISGLHTGNREMSFAIINGVALYGGFPVGGEEWQERDPNAHETILSGDLAGNDEKVSDPWDMRYDPNRYENSHHVVTIRDTDPNTMLAGFTISGGRNYYSESESGGGIFGKPSGMATLSNCMIRDNFAKEGGGLAYCDGQITGCTIAGNAAEVGGGLYRCNGSIENCTIDVNSAYFGIGGLIYCDGPIKNCTISNNNGGGLGGCDGPISNCLISDNWTELNGGGLSGCDGSISNCTINGNTAMRDGGGLFRCDGAILNCTISDNSALWDEGGGLYMCDGRITGCTINSNYAYWYGGGLAFCNGKISICTISNNTAIFGGGIFGRNIFSCNTIEKSLIIGNRASRGGGMCYHESTISLTNCTITGNRAFIGGGMYNNSSSQIVANCTFSGNIAPHGNALAFDNYPYLRSSAMQMKNCILWDGGDEIWNNDGSSITIRYSDIQGGWSGLGNIDVDPLFMRSGYWDANGTSEDESDDYWEEGDYHLQPDSPCIDSGNYIYYMHFPTRDREGNCRLAGSQIDMGCFEYGSSSDTDGDWLPDILEPEFAENADRDLDGLVDGIERLQGTDANVPDPLRVWEIPEDAGCIQEALFFSRDGETIKLEEGIYYENIYIGGRNISLTSMEPNNSKTIARTILDGDIDQDVNTLNGSVITFDGSEDERCLIKGLTIQGGYSITGGGIRGNKCWAKLYNCTIQNNKAIYDGGGVYDFRGEITQCQISQNKSGRLGGGLGNCYGLISACHVYGNQAYWGGGIYGAFGPVYKCNISGNKAKYDGGGLHYKGLIIQCKITGNRASRGGGAYCLNNSSLMNCTIADNYADVAGGLYTTIRSGPTTYLRDITNCVFWNEGEEIDGNYFRISYCDIQGGRAGCNSRYDRDIIWANGNINTDSLFVKTGYWDEHGTPGDESDDFYVEGDYRLKSEGWRWDSERGFWGYDDVTSRCIDAGNPGTPLGEEPLTVPDDPENLWGINKRVNMGAYGGTAEASMGPHGWSLLGDLTNDGIVNLVDYNWQVGDWLETVEEQAGDLNRDGIINVRDLWWLAEDWLRQTVWYE